MTTSTKAPALTNGITFRRLRLTDAYLVTLWDEDLGTVGRGLSWRTGRQVWTARVAGSSWPVGLVDGYPGEYATRAEATNALVADVRGQA